LLRAGNVTRNNPALSRLSSLSGVSAARSFNTNSAGPTFDVYWAKLWDQIVPYQDTDQLPASPTADNAAALSELKTFTGSDVLLSKL